MPNALIMGREDLREELKELWREILKEAEKLATEKTKDSLITADEVCEILKVSLTTIWRWQQKEYLIPVYIGGKKRYKMSDIQRIVQKGDEV